jgi:hypothetical protein
MGKRGLPRPLRLLGPARTMRAVRRAALSATLALLCLTGCSRCAPAPAAPVEVVEPPPAPVAEPEPATEPAPEPEPPAFAATVTARQGTVEVSHREGAWAAVEVGDRLLETDRVRTQGDSRVDLGVNHVKVTIHEHSEFLVKQVTQTAIRARVRGRLESAVEDGRGSLEIESEGSGAVVKTDGGHFSMLADGRGVLAVSTVSGVVTVAAEGKEVEVGKGKWTTVQPGGGPSAPSPAVRRVLLAVKWPGKKETNRKSLPVAGKVSPGTRVLVQGRLVEVGRDGQFETEVPLRRGRQKIAVTAIGVGGQRKVSSDTVLMDDRPNSVELAKDPWER